MSFAEVQVLIEENRELLRGPKGVKGDRGEPGRDGTRGETGPIGRAGKSITGPPGRDGRDGKDGVDGKSITGPVGKIGPPGKDGVGTDEKVRVSQDDPTAGFLAAKLTAGSGIEIRTAGGKRGERLVIDAKPQGGGGGGQSGIIAYDDGVAVGAGNKVSFDGGDPVTISGGLIHVPVGSGAGGDFIPQGGPLTEDLDADGAGITNLPLPGAPGDAANKQYVDDATVLPMLGAILGGGPDYNNADGNAIINLADPTDPQDAATKQYVDTNTIPQGGPLTADLDADGAGITNLPLPGAPGDAANKQYVDDATVLPMLGAILGGGPDYNNADGNAIINLADPTDPQDAATKQYVDTNTIPQGGPLTADLATGGFGLTGTDGAVISVTSVVAANGGDGVDSTGAGFEATAGSLNVGGDFTIHGGNGSVEDGARVETRGGTATDPGRVAITTDNDTGSSGDLLTAQGDGTAIWVPPSGLPGSPETYTEANVVTDRGFDASASTLDEVLHVLGSLISDLRARGVVA